MCVHVYVCARVHSPVFCFVLFSKGKPGEMRKVGKGLTIQPLGAELESPGLA